MKKSCTALQYLVPLITIMLLVSCNNADKKTAVPGTDSSKPATAVKEKEKEKIPAEKPAIINISDTISTRAIVLYMKDSVASFDRISIKLGKIYGVKLAEVLKKNGLKMAGAPMAWYTTMKPPYFFEAGAPVNKKPAKLSAGVFVREMGADSVVVAHFYGPYNLLSQGYEAIKERMKDEKRTVKSAPYEIYIGDPMDKNGKMIDPYKVRTDIVFPFK